MSFLKISLLSLLCILSANLMASTALPDFSKFKDVKQKKTAFFNYLQPYIEKANGEILQERKFIQTVNFSHLSTSQTVKIESLMAKYRVTDKVISAQTKTALLTKVDVIPASLALAQAANESAWGTSRFARKAFNFYGQWCFSKGCGLVPLQRTKGMTHEVRKFSSPYESVKGYMLNLNRHKAFKLVRTERLKQRKQKLAPTGLKLAKGLVHYSERKHEYVKEISSMIRYNKLARFD
ncbi:MAG: Bax protein [Thiomicrorhabdus sp.]|nr:MAG: Bax protein [Thiomicrorhabdus sp.]